MSLWTGAPEGARLAPEERWLAYVGLVWAPFAGTYTVLCHHAGAPAVMWVASGLMALYGLWLAVVAPVRLRSARGGCTYEIDSGGFRVVGPGGQIRSRLMIHDVRRHWVEAAGDGTSQLWVRTRDGQNLLLFVGIPDASSLNEALAQLSPEPDVEA